MDELPFFFQTKLHLFFPGFIYGLLLGPFPTCPVLPGRLHYRRVTRVYESINEKWGRCVRSTTTLPRLVLLWTDAKKIFLRNHAIANFVHHSEVIYCHFIHQLPDSIVGFLHID